MGCVGSRPLRNLTVWVKAPRLVTTGIRRHVTGRDIPIRGRGRSVRFTAGRFVTLTGLDLAKGLHLVAVGLLGGGDLLSGRTRGREFLEAGGGLVLGRFGLTDTLAFAFHLFFRSEIGIEQDQLRRRLDTGQFNHGGLGATPSSGAGAAATTAGGPAPRGSASNTTGRRRLGGRW